MILNRSDGVINFIDYESREFVGYKQDFVGDSDHYLTISHDPRLNIYIITSPLKTIIYDDFSFEIKIKMESKVLDVGVGIDGTVLFLLSSNKIVKKSLVSKDLEENIEIPQGNLKQLQYSPNSLFYAAMVNNPYSINIWASGNNQTLFSFNENAKFDNFCISGDFNSLDSSKKIQNYVVCYD